MSENNKKFLSVENLVVEYTSDGDIVHAVNGVSFQLDKGKTLGLVGETGAGKTTIAKAIMRILQEPPAAIRQGKVMLEGVDLLQLSKKEMYGIRGNKISMIFQDPMTSLNPVHKVGEQIAEVVAIHNTEMSRAQAKQQAVEMLERVGIPAERYVEYPHQLSLIHISFACANASCGQFSMPRISSQKKITSSMHTRATAVIREISVPTVSLTRFSFFAPISCAMYTCPALAKAVAIGVIISDSSPPVETPTVPMLPTYWPMMTRSTMEYNCWIRLVSTMGTAKASSNFKIGPSVKFMPTRFFLIVSTKYSLLLSQGTLFLPSDRGLFTRKTYRSFISYFKGMESSINSSFSPLCFLNGIYCL